MKKTQERIDDLYYGITVANVKWALEKCNVCALKASNKTKSILTPITSNQCLDRLYIDLMDLCSKPDGRYKWVLQVKITFQDTFGCML